MDYDPEKYAKEAADQNWRDFIDAINSNPNTPVIFCAAGTRKAIENTMVFKAKMPKKNVSLSGGSIAEVSFAELAVAYRPDECAVWLAEVARMCGDLDIGVFAKFVLQLADTIREGNFFGVAPDGSVEPNMLSSERDGQDDLPGPSDENPPDEN